tara:strand:- start:263 stop:496 length:234 start_codon:yes stop_codon:yes gene_type:complete
MARFNKIPFAMVFPKITKITVKKDVLEASSQLLNNEKMYERKKFLTREQQRELNEKYLYQNLPKIEKMYERLYRKKI